MTIIKFQGVSKAFNGVVLFNSVNFDLVKGKIYGFIGPNGSGKSVLFKMICGFVFPDQGTIYVNGINLGTAKNRFPKNVGIVIDRPGYIGSKTGFENLKDLSLIKNMITDSEIKNSMELVGLNPDAKQQVKNYSVGMKQKLALAQSFMEDQEILVLDEPFNGLDETSVENVRSLLISLKNAGKTILLSSHNKEDVSILCDQVYRINNYKVELVVEHKELNII